MAIWLTEQSRVVVAGITGTEGARHTSRMLACGTQVVAGTNPNKAGQYFEDGDARVPVFATISQAAAETGADTVVIFVPARHVMGVMTDAIEAGVAMAVVVTEGVPVHDTAAILAHAASAASATPTATATHTGSATSTVARTRIIGPNSPGIASPCRSNAGIIPADIAGRGRLGLVSRSGTLTYQLMHELRDIGFSTCVGIGGDPIVGTTHIDALTAFEDDAETDIIIMIGEIGGEAEELAAAFIPEHVSKPVVAYIAGFTAPQGRTMGHAGAIISGSSGTAVAKQRALEDAGVLVGRTPSETARFVREVMSGR